ncbi:MAG: hypothetical protein FWC34_11210 [Bacteroidetes bacterium]|nr:hypothetical protein [Bacteroidota bacterium]MCL2302257.1 hypothetical protein [Lentimicrobiaceae bacterium]
MKVLSPFLGAMLLILLLFAACTPSQTQFAAIPSEPVEYPVGQIAQYISTNLSDLQVLYPLPEEFLENFMKMHTQYEGAHPTVATEFPDEWGVVLVERLPEGRELYQIQSKNREWVFLVITSGYGTQRILDLLPVAVNLARQTQDVLETEIWTTERASDGTFTVTKKYEWVHSVENITQEEYDANPQDFLRTKTVTDKYFINDFYRFEKIVTENTPDYSAVIFYYKDEKPEDWDDIVPLLQAFCEDYDILFEEAHKNFDQLRLRDYKFNFITELDITSYMDLSEGVIFMKKGEVPKTVPFGGYERIKIELKRYFKIVEA